MSVRPVRYMERSRAFYAAKGHAPYRWAHFDDVPFTRLAKPLAASRVTTITTAVLPLADGIDHYSIPRVTWCARSSPVPDAMYTMHRGWDKEATHTEDVGAFLPLAQLHRAAAAGRIGEVAPRFFGAPTQYSQQTTIDEDAPRILEWCREDSLDVAVLCPLCPVCHQTLTLVARHLEANGIPTVLMGSASDVVEHVGAPRFLFTDYPLGNPCGMPFMEEEQDALLEMALSLLESASIPRTTLQSPFRWPTDEWRERFMDVPAAVQHSQPAG